MERRSSSGVSHNCFLAPIDVEKINTNSNGSVSTDPSVSEPKKPRQTRNGKKPDSAGVGGSKKSEEGKGESSGMKVTSDGPTSWVSSVARTTLSKSHITAGYLRSWAGFAPISEPWRKVTKGYFTSNINWYLSSHQGDKLHWSKIYVLEKWVP